MISLGRSGRLRGSPRGRSSLNLAGIAFTECQERGIVVGMRFTYNVEKLNRGFGA